MYWFVSVGLSHLFPLFIPSVTTPPSIDVCVCARACVLVRVRVCVPESVYTKQDAKPIMLIFLMFFLNDQRDAKQVFSLLLEKQAQAAQQKKNRTLANASIINQQNVDGDTAILVCVIT
jgi:hypothetical protein